MKTVLGTQSWTWLQYCQAQGQTLEDQLDTVLGQVAEAGLGAWEGYCTSAEQTERLATLLTRHGLAMPTIYAGAKLHEPDWETAVAEVLRQADLARPLGTTLVLCNPDPISWSGTANKDDAQLGRQAGALRVLSTELKQRGMTLAYHTHDAELRASAREFHHMMLATLQAGMQLCLDCHWIYRGAGNSNLALQDIITLYGDRIASVHLRQSQAGVWLESVGPGDLDYDAVARQLRAIGFNGPLVLEISAEAETVHTLSPVEAHRQSQAWVEHTFSAAL